MDNIFLEKSSVRMKLYMQKINILKIHIWNLYQQYHSIEKLLVVPLIITVPKSFFLQI